MEKTQINPWSWQDARGFSQAWKVRDPATTIYVAGQVNLREYTQVKARFITGAQPASTAVQVPALAAPQFMLEVEAIAVV